MTMYGQIEGGEQVLLGILEAYDFHHLGNPAFNRGRILRTGGKSTQYNYDGARLTFQVQHQDGELKAGLVQFAWNDEPDAVFHNGVYTAEEGATITIDPNNPPKKGDPALDGSGLVYEGDENIGGKVQYSGRWIRPDMSAEKLAPVDADGDGLDDNTGAAFGVYADPSSPTGWSLPVNKDGSLP